MVCGVVVAVYDKKGLPRGDASNTLKILTAVFLAMTGWG